MNEGKQGSTITNEESLDLPFTTNTNALSMQRTLLILVLNCQFENSVKIVDRTYLVLGNLKFSLLSIGVYNWFYDVFGAWVMRKLSLCFFL